jgi:hypothetical protein
MIRRVEEMKTLFFILLTLVLNTALFAESYDVYRGNPNYVSHETLEIKPTKIQFNLLEMSSNSGRYFYVKIIYDGPKLMLIRSGRSLVLEYDNNVMSLFSLNGSMRDRDVRTYDVTESALYKITKDQLLKLSNAKKIDFVVRGGVKSHYRSMNQKNIEYIKKFAVDRSILR